ncbi:flagellar hook-length control protein FliK [Alkalilimnicola sp. S0819]|uniref:flagellar hook-length control protein FliK n=1 Tax=Alkalilimnicola sp. S0819 TaxID=2613922 RepID=UPI001262861B|nr:flagellar hook-length control protein FliK [Alkalilimnicola sp. S0819]KAB7627177.1 hypothetical protein F3N43_04500 [Alkalilimnicola sp. S0819]MPQ15889.1 hypothetical protein [Alkalilimnicola sp. S0819]
MMLSSFLQMNTEGAGSALKGALNGALKGEAGGFLTALLEQGGSELSAAELQALQQALAEQGEGAPAETKDLLAALQTLLSGQDATAPQAGLNLMAAADAGQDQEPDPEQLLGLMLAARQGGKGGGEEALAARARQEMLWSRDGQNAAQPQGESALNAVNQAQQNFQAALNKAAEAMPQLRLEHPVQQPGFGQAVGERVSWMANQGLQQARIQLNPAHLGPLEISISVQDDQTQVAIVAQHAQTREALQADMPRLRDMLADQGLNGVDVNVSQDQQGRETEERTAGGGARGTAFADAEGEEDGGVEQSIRLRQGRGLVDQYA